MQINTQTNEVTYETKVMEMEERWKSELHAMLDEVNEVSGYNQILV